jgi:YD repeat-containing protein
VDAERIAALVIVCKCLSCDSLDGWLATVAQLDHVGGRQISNSTLDSRVVVEVTHLDQLGRPWLVWRSDDTSPLSETGESSGILTKTFARNTGTGSSVKTSNPHRSSESTVSWTIARRDSAGRVYEVEKPGSNIAKTTHHDPISRTACDEAASAASPDAANPGTCRKLEVDALGRVVKVTEGSQSGGPSYVTQYAYDALGKLRTVTQGARSRTFDYDPLGRLVTANNPESGIVEYRYDDNGNLKSRWDARVTMCFGPWTRATTPWAGAIAARDSTR